MNFESIWKFLQVLSGRWEFVIGLFALVVLMNQLAKMRPYASILVFPVFLLIIRKLALFVPVSGTISNENRVIFWSTRAYVYFCILIVIHFLIILGIRFRDKIDWFEEPGCSGCLVFVLAPIGLLIGSGTCLPVNGWCHLYMPVISIIGVTKILIISPLLLPIIWVGILFQLWVVLFARGASGREINKLLAIGVLMGGLVQFSFQLPIPNNSQTISDIRNYWETENTKDEETSDFLGVWARKLPQINQFGVNLVEKVEPSQYQGDRIKMALEEIPDVWDNFLSNKGVRKVLTVSAILLFLFMFVERIRLACENPHNII